MVKVLNFHKVTNPKWFLDLISFLNKDYQLISIENLLEYYTTDQPFKKAIHLTVDDGDKSFFYNVYPVLIKYKIPASIFVSPLICAKELNFWFQEIVDYNPQELNRVISKTLNIPLNKISSYKPENILMCLKMHQVQEIIKVYQIETKTPPKRSQNMTVKQLLEVERSNIVKIGAHTLNHPILANEDDENCNFEISSSINQLSSILGHSINTFAYPNGSPELDFTAREINYLKSYGIQIAFSTEHKDTSFSDNLFSIPRYGITYGSIGFIKTKLFLGSHWDKIKELTSVNEYKIRKELYQILK